LRSPSVSRSKKNRTASPHPKTALVARTAYTASLWVLLVACSVVGPPRCRLRDAGAPLHLEDPRTRRVNFAGGARKATVPLDKLWPPNAPSGSMAISRTAASSPPGTPGVVPTGGYASRTPKRTALQVARGPGPQPLMRRGPTARPSRVPLTNGALAYLRFIGFYAIALW
jgi:hypothetical protein